MAVQAVTRRVRMSSRKAGEVAALVRGRSVAEALVILQHTPRRAARPLLLTVKSAQANAEYNHSYKADSLKIVEISVTPGPALKRYRPVARGRALPFKRPSCHIRVVVDGPKRSPAKKPPAAKAIPAEGGAKEKK